MLIWVASFWERTSGMAFCDKISPGDKDVWDEHLEIICLHTVFTDLIKKIFGTESDEIIKMAFQFISIQFFVLVCGINSQLANSRYSTNKILISKTKITINNL
jgi:hypothetical protein